MTEVKNESSDAIVALPSLPPARQQRYSSNPRSAIASKNKYRTRERAIEPMGGFIKAEDFMINKLDGRADEILVTYIQMLGKTGRKYIVLNDDETLSTNLQELMQIMHPFDPYALAKLHTQQALV